jgi:hypothetical protein
VIQWIRVGSYLKIFLHCLRAEMIFLCKWRFPEKRTVSFTSPSQSFIRKITFVWNRSIHVNGRSTVCLERKPSMLEAGGSSTMVPNEIWVNFWKEHCLRIRDFKREGHQLSAK